jgi:nucleoside-diphosphate kinase
MNDNSMTTEQTLAIIKPDAVAAGHTGEILQMIEHDGFILRALRMSTLTADQARSFYAVHAEKTFYDSLVEFMTSGPVVLATIERTDAVVAWRKLMGSTNPEEAAPGTVRARFGSSIEHNSTHGSDSLENAATEINFFFKNSPF